MKFDTFLPSPFYRVTVKALIFDAQRRLLILWTKNDKVELPGGGWEHGETLEECVKREVEEELHVGASHVGPIQFTYNLHHTANNYMSLRLVVSASVDSHDFSPDDGLVRAEFVTKERFMELDMMAHEGNVKDYVDQIWP